MILRNLGLPCSSYCILACFFFFFLQILHWFTQMCLGVNHIHKKRVLHRDIKSKVNAIHLGPKKKLKTISFNPFSVLFYFLLGAF